MEDEGEEDRKRNLREERKNKGQEELSKWRWMWKSGFNVSFCVLSVYGSGVFFNIYICK